MATAHHNVSLRINDAIVDRWQSYSITNDMLTPADGFELNLSPGVRSAYELVPPDSLVEVRIDGNVVLTGYIDDRELNVDRGGSVLSVSGRDKSGRMVDESARLFTIPRSLDIKSIAERLAEDTFSEVRLDNALNRQLVRGRRSRRVPADAEPLFAKASAAPKKIEIGEKRWEALEHFTKPARLLAWSSADGQALIIGEPNYRQPAQFRFFLPRPGSSRLTEGNIKVLSFRESVANRYSRITVYGASKGNASNYGDRVTRHSATVLQGSGTDGIGDSFRTRKRLFLTDPDIADRGDAENRATREMHFRDAERLVAEITVQGHSQAYSPGDVPTLYAFDTMAELEIEEIGFRGQFLITSCVFSVERTLGEVTQLTLVPKGTDLVS